MNKILISHRKLVKYCTRKPANIWRISIFLIQINVRLHVQIGPVWPSKPKTANKKKQAEVNFKNKIRLLFAILDVFFGFLRDIATPMHLPSDEKRHLDFKVWNLPILCNYDRHVRQYINVAWKCFTVHNNNNQIKVNISWFLRVQG